MAKVPKILIPVEIDELALLEMQRGLMLGLAKFHASLAANFTESARRFTEHAASLTAEIGRRMEEEKNDHRRGS